MLILGLNAYHPNSAACILKDGGLIAAAEEERFNRVKHWAGFPAEAIRYCLREADVSIHDLDYIAVNRDPLANIHKKALHILCKGVSPALFKNRFSNLCKIGSLKESLAASFGVSAFSLKAKPVNIEHHRAHLASSFFVSPFDESAVVSLDGFGDFTSGMVAYGKGDQLKVLYEINFPHSLGLFYTAFTQLLGFRKFGDEYKVMGLAAYGKPVYIDALKRILTLSSNGTYSLDMSYFSFHKDRGVMLWDNTEPILRDCFSVKMEKVFGKARRYEEEILPRHCDLAASFQLMYERALFHVLNRAHELVKTRRLCLSGGCAMNSLANGKIYDQTPFTDIFIQPGSSDAGGALGAAFFLYRKMLGEKKNFVMEHSYWGPHFSDEEIRFELDKHAELLGRCKITRLDDLNDLCRVTAEHIARGEVVGWFQGRMEWGARALGNRSILVDPRRKDMKDILNERIKRREWFRPFAPAILLEHVGEYFEKSYPDPFMLKVYVIRPEKRSLIPAVTHVDGTGRLQTVSEKENPRYAELIREFQRQTGIPILLNTSFNENEPIVCTPYDAIECFLRTKMDLLVAGNYIVEKHEKNPHP